MTYVILWRPGGYVTKRQPNHKPYAEKATDLDTKTWKTREAAQRFLSLKDDIWASRCTIEELHGAG